MRNVKVVIGASFGDEGKGLVTDYLSKDWADLVVRFNGGAQAAHTVKKKNGIEHVFGHFGSGTLNNILTYLSSYFVVNPELYLKELTVLHKKGIYPTVYVNENCFVTTFVDVLINQIVEKFRNKQDKQHGSCGIGFNETITRCLQPEYTLTVKMLREDISLAINKITADAVDYVILRLQELGVTQEFAYNIIKRIDPKTAIERSLKCFTEFLNHVQIVGQSDEFILLAHDNVVFEGAQGLLLDEFHEWFPYVTRSRTGIKNVSKLLQGHDISSIQINYVTRAYTTRHGAGPFPREDKVPYHIIDSTNIPNEYQGNLRVGYLDIDMLRDSIQNDLVNYKCVITPEVRTIITCMDQIGSIVYCYAENGAFTDIPVDCFGELMNSYLDMPILLNGSATTPFVMEKYVFGIRSQTSVSIPVLPVSKDIDTQIDTYFGKKQIKTKVVHINNRI